MDFNYLNGKAIRCKTFQEYKDIVDLIGWWDKEENLDYFTGRYPFFVLIANGQIRYYGNEHNATKKYTFVSAGEVLDRYSENLFFVGNIAIY